MEVIAADMLIAGDEVLSVRVEHMKFTGADNYRRCSFVDSVFSSSNNR